MGKSILSPDMVSIGLLISNGNIDITLEELFAGVMEDQTRNNRIFGVSYEDYRTACFHLVVFEGNLLSKSMDLIEFNQLKFREIIPEMLRYNEVYMNDEGEHWLGDADHVLEECSIGSSRPGHPDRLFNPVRTVSLLKSKKPN